jgi:hypothetical protein
MPVTAKVPIPPVRVAADDDLANECAMVKFSGRLLLRPADATDRPFWFETGPCRILERGRVEDGKLNVTFSVENPKVYDKISRVQDFARRYASTQLVDTTMSFLMLTKRTIDALLSKTAFDLADGMKAGIVIKRCVMVNPDGTRAPFEVGALDAESVSLVIEPTALWVFNRMMGLKWYVTEIHLPNDDWRDPRSDAWSL